jgi:hypothetical protein
MALRLSKCNGDAIDEYLYDNPQIDPYEIAILYNITYNIVIKRKALLHQIELISINNRNKGGHSRIITLEIVKYIITLIKCNITLYQDEIIDYIYIEFNIQLN